MRNFRKSLRTTRKSVSVPRTLHKALLRNTNLDPENLESRELPTAYFFSQGFPDIRAKFKHLERGPLTPQVEVLALALKVYHGRDKKAYKQKYQMLANAIELASVTVQAPLTPGAQGPLGPCFKCGQEDQ